MEMRDKALAVTENPAQITQESGTACEKEEGNKRISPGRMFCNILFGIISLLFAIVAASFAAIISLLGFSVMISEAGLIPLAVCLFFVLGNAIPAMVFGVLSQRAGTISGLNKVSIALTIASSAASTFIFITLTALLYIGSLF